MTFSEKTVLIDSFIKNKYIEIKVGGFSMRPSINSGETVRIERAHKNEIHLGDIIAFFIDTTLIVHRIHRIIDKNSETVFKTKGDAYLSSSHSVPFSEIVGKVVWKHGKNGVVYQTNRFMNFLWVLLSYPISLTFAIYNLCGHPRKN